MLEPESFDAWCIGQPAGGTGAGIELDDALGVESELPISMRLEGKLGFSSGSKKANCFVDFVNL